MDGLDLSSLLNLGGMGAFSALVYLELRKLREAFEGMSTAFVRLEERDRVETRADTVG